MLRLEVLQAALIVPHFISHFLTKFIEPVLFQKDADLHRKDEALTAKEGECAKKDEEMRRLADKQKSLEAAITDLEVSLSSASEKAASLDRAKKKADTEVKRRCHYTWHCLPFEAPHR